MNISFDFEEGITPEGIAEMYSGETGLILTTLKSFVEQRLSVLKDEIEKQKDGYIIIESTSPFNVHFHHFDIPLSKRLISCLTQIDHDYVMNLIWSVLYPEKLPPSN